MSRRHSSFSLLLALCVVGCASPGTSAFFGSPDTRRTLVTVENPTGDDAKVYVVRGTTAIPLGVVRSLSDRTFTLNAALAPVNAELRVRVDTAGRTTFLSEPMLVSRGSELVLRMSPTLKYSSVDVRL